MRYPDDQREDWHARDVSVGPNWLLRCTVGGLLIGGSVLLLATCSDVKAQEAPQCVRLGDVEKGLREQFHERPVGTATTTDGSHAFLFYSAPGGKTFTVVVMDAHGCTKPIAAGVDLEITMPPAGIPS